MRINKSLITYQPASGAGSGTVTSVALSAPTGFTVSGSPVTTSGTLALAFTTGYGIPPLMTGNSGKFLTTNGTTMSWVNIAGTDVTGAALTESDDTNVTMTLGGSPSTALLRSVSMTLGWAGQLAVSRGGTGAGTLTGVVIGNSTSAMTAVAGTAGQFLRRNTANTAYEFRTLQGGDIAGSELTFANDTNVTMTLGGTPASALLQPVSINLGWTGQLAVSRGGTGASTLTGVLIGNGTSAVTAITGTAGQILRRNTGNTAYEFWSANYLVNPMTLEGSIIYATTGGTPAELFANSTSTRKYLSQINGTAPTWEALPASVSGSGTTNYIAKWTPSGTVLGNSQIYDNGLNVGIGMIPTYKLDIEGTDLLVQRIRSTTNTGAAVFLAQNDLSNQYEAGIFGSTRTGLGAVASGNAYTGSTQPFVIFGSEIKFGIGSGITERMRLNSSGYLGINKNNPQSYLDIDGSIAAGSLTSTDGSIILQDNYTNGHLSNIGTMYSGGSLMLGYSVTPSLSSSTGFVSATGLSDIPRSSIVVGENVSIYTGAIQSVAIGSLVTMSEKLRLTNAGDLQIITGNIQLNTATNITWGGAYGTDIPTISGTSGSGSNGFLQFYPAGSTSGVKMALRRTGQLALPSYTSSSAFTGTSVATLAVDAAGDVITIAPQQTTASGTYTPTWTGLSNVDSVTSFSSQYMRVGDTVTVSGWVTINATADNTPTSLSFSLPINSDTSVVNRLNGTGVAQGGGVAACLSGYGSNFGEFEVLPSVDTSVNYSFHFTYRIV